MQIAKDEKTKCGKAPKLGVMIIGPGWVAGEHIKGYLANPHTELKVMAGVVKEDEARAKEYMKKLNFQCDYTDNYEKVLNREDIDIVSICTINHLHYEETLASIQAGKHTFTEKPLALKLKEVRNLIRQAKKNRVKTQVGHIVRFYPAIQKMKDYIRSNLIGEPFYGESDYWHEISGGWKVKVKTAGSALLMGGVHGIDTLRFLLGEEKEAEQVFAYSKEATRRSDFEYHPTVSLLIKFKDGSIGKVSTSLESAMPYTFHLQVCGTKGTIRNKNFYSTKVSSETDKFTPIQADYPDDWNVSRHPFNEEISYFIDSIVNNRPSELSFEKAYPTYEIIFAAEESIRLNKPVKLPLKMIDKD